METADQDSEDLKKSVVEWLSEKEHIAIADYQRSYAWSESHVTAFVETLLDALADEERGAGTRAPDIGVVVIEKTKSDETSSDTPSSDASKEERFHVVDGQQRLLTFSLLVVALCGETVCGTENGDRNRSSRLRQLLHPQNLESVIHARQVARKIRNLLSRRPEFRALEKLVREGKLAWLAPVTFSVVEFERKAGDGSNAAVANFFEPLNTTAKPLNGGQILKAHHMGRILKDEPTQTWACQSQYEQWIRRCSGADFELQPFEPVCFNTGERLSIERFIDSPAQDARYKLGCGFVQAVQALLLGQGDWWWEIARQGNERRLPFERLEGTRRNAAPNGRPWRAAEPLDFPEAEGFFRMTARLGRIYDAYCRELSELTCLKSWAEKNGFADRPLLEEEDSDRRPARLVVSAARRLAAFGNVLEKWSAEGSRLQEETALRAFCHFEEKKPATIAEQFLRAKSWLGIGREGENFHVTFGFLSVAPIAVALLWCDRFPSSESDEDILRLLTLQLLFANIQAQSHSVLRALAVPEAVVAAHFSSDSQGALWRYLKTARFEGTVRPRALESMLERMPGGREAVPSNVTPSDEEEKALAELRSILSQYLSF